MLSQVWRPRLHWLVHYHIEGYLSREVSFAWYDISATEEGPRPLGYSVETLCLAFVVHMHRGLPPQ